MHCNEEDEEAEGITRMRSRKRRKIRRKANTKLMANSFLYIYSRQLANDDI